jgi:hypothetical protein
MELLLNLVWASLVALALLAFLRCRRLSIQIAAVPYCKSLLALTCGLVLLFPVISASDDLHPTQPMVEEASKRLQRAVAPLHLQSASPTLPVLPALLALCLLWSLVLLHLFNPLILKTLLLSGMFSLSAGRAPPSFWN